MFHELTTKIVDEPLSDQAKISAYLTGIQDPTLYQNLIIEPSTGTRWSDFNKLYDYVLNKYSLLTNFHTQRPIRASFQQRNNGPRRSWQPQSRSNQPQPQTTSHLNCALSRSNQPYRRPFRFNNPNKRPQGHFITYRPPPKRFPPHAPPFRKPYSDPERPYHQRPRPPFQSRPFNNKRPFRSSGPPTKRMHQFSGDTPNHFATLSIKDPPITKPQYKSNQIQDSLTFPTTL